MLIIAKITDVETVVMITVQVCDCESFGINKGLRRITTTAVISGPLLWRYTKCSILKVKTKPQMSQTCHH